MKARADLGRPYHRIVVPTHSIGRVGLSAIEPNRYKYTDRFGAMGHF
jgi:hypothetical protein